MAGNRNVLVGLRSVSSAENEEMPKHENNPKTYTFFLPIQFMTKYLKFYDLKKYLFEEVSGKFRREGVLGAIDFFCILIWKAERAKNTNKEKLRKKYPDKNLNWIVRKLTMQVSEAASTEEKLRILLRDWKFRLPTASAILTVLYPDEFTVYDVNVCEELGYNKYLSDRTTESAIKGYFDFMKKVKENTPAELSLRDKDRYLIGKHFFEKLKKTCEN